MLTNADITIFNMWYNPETKKKEYKSTILTGVHWYTDQKVNVGEKGLASADVYKIRIPEEAKVLGDKVYIDVAEYRLLNVENVNKYWTIDNNDLFVKGNVDLQVEKISDLTTRYLCVGRIVSFSDNRGGLEPHFRIGGAS